MTLPPSGLITSDMINVELYRAANTPFTLNDTVVRRLAGVTTPNTAISFADFLGKTNEVVATLANSNSIVLKNYFTSDDWNNPNINKRVLIPSTVQIGATNLTYAIAPTDSASGQAGSWKGVLTLDIKGTVSGMGGQPNSGAGGSCIWMNFPGADGQKMNIINSGILRAGGGAGGVGGVGGPGYYFSPYTYREPASDWYYNPNSSPFTCWLGSRLWWFSGGEITSSGYDGIVIDGWQYFVGPPMGSNPNYRAVARSQTRYSTVYTSGGAGGTAGRGQGFDGTSTVGAGGALGGPNAGTGGTGGTGAPYGNTGGTGGSGGAGNNGGGGGGAAGGQAGYYIINNAYANITNTGTILGRLG